MCPTWLGSVFCEIYSSNVHYYLSYTRTSGTICLGCDVAILLRVTLRYTASSSIAVSSVVIP